MWPFYRDLARHSPGVLLRSLVRTDTVFDILSKIVLAAFVGVSNPVTGTALGWWNASTGGEVTLNGVPLWWSAVLLGTIFLHGLFRYAKEDKDKVESEKKALENKLAAYEASGAPKVVRRIENKGPVSIKEWSPSEIQPDDRTVACVVPYKTYETACAYVDDPATTVEVQDADDDILISVSYKVRGDGWAHPRAGAWGVQMDTFVHVLDEEGTPVRTLYTNVGWINIAEDGTWRHEATGGEHLLGLPKGKYGLNVFDLTDILADFSSLDKDAYPTLKSFPTDKAVDIRSSTRREYSDMRLTARRL